LATQRKASLYRMPIDCFSKPEKAQQIIWI